MEESAAANPGWRKSSHSAPNGGAFVEVGAWRKSSYSNGGAAACVEVGAWRKSSHSGNGGGACVEVGAWRKSSYSNGGAAACVEVSGAATGVLVRDTTDRAGAVLTVTAAAWRTLLAEIRA